MISVTAGAADSSETLMAVITTEIYRRIAPHRPVSAAAAPPLSASSLPIQAGTLLSEQDRIRYALAQANGNCTQAAGLLNISRTTLWRKMKPWDFPPIRARTKMTEGMRHERLRITIRIFKIYNKIFTFFLGKLSLDRLYLSCKKLNSIASLGTG